MTIPTTRAGLLVAALAAAALAASVSDAAAQTPVTAVGLGAPVPSIDARAAALGGTGLGLPDGSISSRNPADIGLFGRPTLGITYAPEDVSVKGPDGSADGGRSRMAVLRGAVPVGDWAFGVSFAAELDQDWQIQFSDTLFAEEGTFPFTEQRSQDGGVSSVNFTVARRLGSVSVGAEYGVMTGRVQQTYRRDFGPDVDDPSRNLAPAGGAATWKYSGSRIRVGAAANLTDRISVGADFSHAGDLEAVRDTVDGATRRREYGMATGVELGASARLSDRLLVTGAGGWTAWDGAEGGSSGYVASDVIWAGVGAELGGVRFLGAEVPLRLGLRRTDLPFHAPGDRQASETALTFGLGIRVADEQARIDFAFEAGKRGDLGSSTIEESFQRLSLSFALYQN